MAILIRVVSELRRRKRAFLSVVLLVGLGSGAVLSAAAGARRTDSSYQRLLRTHQAADVVVLNFAFAGEVAAKAGDIGRMPEVRAVAPARFGCGFLKTCFAAVSDSRYGRTVNRWEMIEGRRFSENRPDEIVVGFVAARDNNIRVGATIPFPDPPAKTLLSLHVVGIAVAPGEFPPDVRGRAQVFMTPAFHEMFVATHPELFFPGDDSVWVRLERGKDTLGRFESRIRALTGAPIALLQPQAEMNSHVQRTIHLQALALWALSGALLVAIVLVLSQLLGRATHDESTDFGVLRALGMTRRELTLVGILRAGLVGAPAAALAVLVATAASPFFPLGLARVAAIRPGFAFDAAVLGAGVSAIATGVCALTLWPSWVAARRAGGRDDVRAHVSWAASALAKAGAPPVATTGVRMALEPGSGSASVPVRTTLIGMTLAAAFVVATLTFGWSLQHLTQTPKLYGVAWDAAIYNTDEPGRLLGHLDEIAANPMVAGLSWGDTGAPISLDTVRTEALTLDTVSGNVHPFILEGRALRKNATPSEVVVGTRVLRAIHKRVGDMAKLRIAGSDALDVHIVGRGVIPVADFGEGIWGSNSTGSGITSGNQPPQGGLFVDLADGVTAEQLRDDLVRRYGGGSEIQPFAAPRDAANFGQVEDLPLALAGILSALALAVLLHTVLSAVRRRRVEIAILKTIGFARRDVWTAVLTQASTIVILALVVGIPVGIAAGRWLWRVFADGLGVLDQPVVRTGTVALAGLAAFLLANAIAALPARSASRTLVAVTLRTE